MNCRLIKAIFKTQFTGRINSRCVYLNIPCEIEKYFSSNNIKGILSGTQYFRPLD